MEQPITTGFCEKLREAELVLSTQQVLLAAEYLNRPTVEDERLLYRAQEIERAWWRRGAAAACLAFCAVVVVWGIW